MRKIYFLFFLFITGISVSAQWNTDVSVNLEMAGLQTADMQPVVTKSGKTWVAFFTGGPGNYKMRAQLLDVNGNKLLGTDGILVSDKPSWSSIQVFNVAVDQSDNLIIGFDDRRVNGTTPQAIGYKIGPDGSFLWGPDGVVLGQGFSPYPCALSNGETVFAWIENATSTLHLQKITASGGVAWPAAIPVRVGSSRTTRGQIIANDNGKFTMVFQRSGIGISTTLFAQRYNNDGTNVWAAPVQLCNQTTQGTRYYSIAAENDTTYFGYMASQGSRFNSFLQRINPDGTIPWGINGTNFNTSVAATDNYQMETVISLTPGSPYVWAVATFCNPTQTQYGIYTQKYAKNGGARQFGNTGKEVYPISTSADRVTNLSLVNDAPMFMHYTQSNYKIYATRLDTNGDFAWTGNNILLSSTTATLALAKGRFGFVGLGDRQAIAVWYENRAGQYRPYAQNITPGGLFKLVVGTQGSVPPTITTAGGTLQMKADVFPSNASQQVTWSLVPGTTANAIISVTGLITGQPNGNGTVWAKAVSVADNSVMDSMLVTISNQIIPATGLKVSVAGNMPPTIISAMTSLQMIATINPATATDQSVTWSIVPVTGKASISATGLISPLDNGTVWAKAVSNQNPMLKDSMLITISGQWANLVLSGLQVYPVPTVKDLHLKLLMNHRATNLRIINSNGTTVYSEMLPENALRTEKIIDMERFPAGVYILRFSGNMIYRSIKIMKL